MSSHTSNGGVRCTLEHPLQQQQRENDANPAAAAQYPPIHRTFRL
jgi:hypothetical protein